MARDFCPADVEFDRRATVALFGAGAMTPGRSHGGREGGILDPSRDRRSEGICEGGAA